MNGLGSALSIATEGLAVINQQLGLVSNNVANANTPDYSSETANQESIVAAGQGLGVSSEPATRQINLQLQQSLFQQDTAVSGLTTTTNGLQDINALLGSPGAGDDLSSLLGNVQTAFSTLLGDPSNAAQQTAVVQSASTLTNSINALSNAYDQQRQATQNDVVTQVTNMNSDLSQIGTLNNQIAIAQVQGQSTASLDNQRDSVVHSLSNILSIQTLVQPNGTLLVSTSSGTQLPTVTGGTPVQTTPVTVGPQGTYTNFAIPPITVAGEDITSQIQGGQLGADITLRDTTLPTFQGELDEFSQSLASRFQAQGLTLFSDPNGNVPPGNEIPAQAAYVGFASEIQVNPTVLADPSLVRDGTNDIEGSPTGAAQFTVNPPGGPAGFTTLINNILDYALGSEAQQGVPQTPLNTTELGPDGTLTAPYGPPATLGEEATAVVSAQAAVSSSASSQLSAEQAVQTNLANNMATVSGVSMDTQMSLMIQLENAYGANARVIATVQSLFTQLETVVQ